MQKAFKDQVKPKQAEVKAKADPSPPKKAGEANGANGANGASPAKKADEAKAKPANGADPARAKEEVESIKKEVKKDPEPKAKPVQTPPPAPEMTTQGFVDNFAPKIRKTAPSSSASTFTRAPRLDPASSSTTRQAS